MGAGLQTTLTALNIYAYSVLQFVAQLLPPPDSWKEDEREALRYLCPGPRGWIVPAVLHRADILGLGSTMLDVEHLSLAARYRVALFENAFRGGLHVARRARHLRHARLHSDHLDRVYTWSAWYSSAMVFHLEAAVAHFSQLGWGPQALRSAIEQRLRSPQADPQTLETRVRTVWQRQARIVLSRTAPPTHLLFYRRRLDRWNIPLLRGHRVERFQGLMRRLRSLVPPRVLAAAVRTNFNGWCTQRRFGSTAPCMFGCTGSDCIEHYAFCPVVTEFMNGVLAGPGYPQGGHRLEEFLLLSKSADRYATGELTARALCTAAVYLAHCRHRHTAGPSPTVDTLRQICTELARNHPCAHALAYANPG